MGKDGRSDDVGQIVAAADRAVIARTVATKQQEAEAGLDCSCKGSS